MCHSKRWRRHPYWLSHRCALLDVTWRCCWIRTRTILSFTTRTLWTLTATHRCWWRGSSTCGSQTTDQPKKKHWWNSKGQNNRHTRTYLHTSHSTQFYFHFTSNMSNLFKTDLVSSLPLLLFICGIEGNWLCLSCPQTLPGNEFVRPEQQHEQTHAGGTERRDASEPERLERRWIVQPLLQLTF